MSKTLGDIRHEAALWYADAAEHTNDANYALQCERGHAELVAQLLDKTPKLGARLPHVGGDE